MVCSDTAQGQLTAMLLLGLNLAKCREAVLSLEV